VRLILTFFGDGVTNDDVEVGVDNEGVSDDNN
jgi:hypothetical protein